jgi:hypothetical protein
MNHRKFRIAWSVTTGILCLLLIVLWVRSYWICETVHGRIPLVPALKFISRDGQVFCYSFSNDSFNWYHRVISDEVADSWRDLGKRPQFGFDYFQFGNLTSIALPFWLPVVLTTTIAASPWIRWHVSLRTLLIATTVFAVILGLADITLRGN